MRKAASSQESKEPRNPESSASGGALVMVLIIVCVLSVVASSMLLTTTTRYHTTYQSASWQEAIVGAEAGVDLAMTELRKRVVNGPSHSFQTAALAAKSGTGGAAPAYWTVTNPAGTAYPNYGHAFPASNQPYLLASHGGEGNTALQARVYVDVPGSDTLPTPTNFAVTTPGDNNAFISQFDNPNLRDPDGVDRSRWWYRIRSLGVAGVTGPPLPNLEKLDNRLRRFSFLTDWRTGDAVASPQVSRMVEVLVRPEMNFRNALMADKRIDLSNQDVLIDSYDSSKGYYDSATNHGTMGNIATNGQLINANHATVNGDALTNNGTTADGDKVTGQQSSNFYQELTPLTAGLLNPGWSAVTDGGTLQTDAAYTASTDATNPTLVRLDGINLPDGNHVINFTAPDTVTDGSPTYVKLYVQGDIKTTGSSYISVGANVNLIVYFTGNIDLQGNGFLNNSFLARNAVFNGVQPPVNADGTYPDRSINIATSQDFEGIIYAPNHDLSLALTAVPPGGTVGTPTVAPVTDPKTLTKIIGLQQKIAQDNADLINKQLVYANDLASYNQNSTNHGDSNKLQKDLADIARLQGKIASLQAQLNALTGTPPSSTTEDHARGYNGIYGGFISKTITVANKTHLHYDETLRTAGPVNHYEIVNWFEDNASHGTTGSSTAFWWAGAK